MFASSKYVRLPAFVAVAFMLAACDPPIQVGTINVAGVTYKIMDEDDLGIGGDGEWFVRVDGERVYCGGNSDNDCIDSVNYHLEKKKAYKDDGAEGGEGGGMHG